MFPGPTSHVETVDFVFFFIVGISVILLLGITAAMIYFVFKYNRKKGHKPEDIHGSILLETIWIVIPTILVMAMFYYGYIGFEEMRTYPADAMEIKVTARMWSWEFNYENGKKTDTLYVPLGRSVKLSMQSLDVNHSFYIPAFRVKEDVIAGKTNYLGFKPERVGSYDVACAEYCGLQHSMMYTKVVVSENEFTAWLEKEEENNNVETGDGN
jgi:cytochrome c oxidase subunit 2